MSLLPRSFQADRMGGAQHQSQDCQGNALQVDGTKEAEIFVEEVGGESLQLNHTFVVGEFTSCLTSLGQKWLVHSS